MRNTLGGGGRIVRRDEEAISHTFACWPPSGSPGRHIYSIASGMHESQHFILAGLRLFGSELSPTPPPAGMLTLLAKPKGSDGGKLYIDGLHTFALLDWFEIKPLLLSPDTDAIVEIQWLQPPQGMSGMLLARGTLYRDAQ